MPPAHVKSQVLGRSTLSQSQLMSSSKYAAGVGNLRAGAESTLTCIRDHRKLILKHGLQVLCSIAKLCCRLCYNVVEAANDFADATRPGVSFLSERVVDTPCLSFWLIALTYV